MSRAYAILLLYLNGVFGEKSKDGSCWITMVRSFRQEEQSVFVREALTLEPSSVSLFTTELLTLYDEPRSEGYDEYFDPPLESKYECPICLLGLREPVQASCGHRFCRGCILRSIRWGRSVTGIFAYAIHVLLTYIPSLFSSGVANDPFSPNWFYNIVNSGRVVLRQPKIIFTLWLYGR